MSDVTERFLKYVKIDTQSADNSGTLPSTDKQFDLARLLEKELIDMGAEDVKLSDKCYVTATIPANDSSMKAVMGLIAHVDTSDAVSGADVKTVITENYDGKDIDMGNGYTLSPKEYPSLSEHKGNTVICTDGTTLLGADDKAGVAEIMAAAKLLLSKDAPKHGKIRICFTPDEEIGCGVDGFEVGEFGADFAYTVDGGELGEVSYENFNAGEAKIEFSGVSIHPGSAKGKMVNAQLVAMELHSMLPSFMNPACTDGYDGFFHLCNMSGSVDRAELVYIIRDFDGELYDRKCRIITDACDYINKKYGYRAANLTIRENYRNMSAMIDPSLIERVKTAMSNVDVTPIVEPIRGGTDGARLSYMGLPCPNICTGGYNFHGRYEYITAEAMEKVVEIILELASIAE